MDEPADHVPLNPNTSNNRSGGHVGDPARGAPWGQVLHSRTYVSERPICWIAQPDPKVARDLALFNLAIDSKLRGCDLVALRVRDICHGSVIASREIVMQKKTARPVQVEVIDQTKAAVADWIELSGRRADDFLFPSRVRNASHLSTDNTLESLGHG